MPRNKTLHAILKEDNPLLLNSYLLRKDLSNIDSWMVDAYGLRVHMFLLCASEIKLNNFEFLLDNYEDYFDIDMRDSFGGATALLKLCLRLSMTTKSNEIKPHILSLIRKLLDKGANPYIRDQEGMCALSRALIYGGHWAVVDILINEYRIDLDKTQAFNCYLGTNFKEFKFKDLKYRQDFIRLENLFRPLVVKNLKVKNKRVQKYFNKEIEGRPVINPTKHKFIRKFYIAKQWCKNNDEQHLLKLTSSNNLEEDRMLGVGRDFLFAARAADILPYSIPRLIKMINNTKYIFLISDTVKMYELVISKMSFDNNQDLNNLAKVFLEKMPKKPQDFKVVHDYLQEVCSELNDTNFNLNQKEILNLENKSYKTYKVIIPKTNIDLKELGSKLDICVGNGLFGERVLSKEIYIISLYDDKEPVACISLDSQLRVIESRGKRNILFDFDINKIL